MKKILLWTAIAAGIFGGCGAGAAEPPAEAAAYIGEWNCVQEETDAQTAADYSGICLSLRETEDFSLTLPDASGYGVWEMTEDGIALYLLSGEYEEALFAAWEDGRLHLEYGALRLALEKAE